MTENLDFLEFPKMPRLSREVIITEKIDGTNAQLLITEAGKY
ncbi:MAG: RNA ligase family protein [Bacteroidota bacterium]